MVRVVDILQNISQILDIFACHNKLLMLCFSSSLPLILYPECYLHFEKLAQVIKDTYLFEYLFINLPCIFLIHLLTLPNFHFGYLVTSHFEYFTLQTLSFYCNFLCTPDFTRKTYW